MLACHSKYLKIVLSTEENEERKSSQPSISLSNKVGISDLLEWTALEFESAEVLHMLLS